MDHEKLLSDFRKGNKTNKTKQKKKNKTNKTAIHKQ